MSNALLEYMAAGRAIVATDVGANSRLIRHEQEGLIVSSGDEAALGGAIRRFLHDPQLARGCALAARTRAASEFSRTAMVRRFEDFYAVTYEMKTARGVSAGSKRRGYKSDS